jgi:hypothetical protein
LRVDRVVPDSRDDARCDDEAHWKPDAQDPKCLLSISLPDLGISIGCLLLDVVVHVRLPAHGFRPPERVDEFGMWKQQKEDLGLYG